MHVVFLRVVCCGLLENAGAILTIRDSNILKSANLTRLKKSYTPDKDLN